MQMLLQQNGVYLSWINGHKVELVYKKRDEAELWIDSVYRGACQFAYTKKAINQIEENPIHLYSMDKADQVLLKELKEPK